MSWPITSPWRAPSCVAPSSITTRNLTACRRATASATLRPVTAGTRTSGTSFAMNTRTGSPIGTWTPGSGTWSTTRSTVWPGWAATYSHWNSRPWPFARVRAAERFCDARSGTKVRPRSQSDVSLLGRSSTFITSSRTPLQPIGAST